MRALLLLLALATAKPVVPPVVSATQLWSQYRTNPAVADAKYRDKELLVLGVVRAVSATYTVYLDGGPGQVDGVTAVPDAGQYENMSHFQVGKSAALICTCVGLVFNEPILLRCKTP
jgi:hypothetical protein